MQNNPIPFTDTYLFRIHSSIVLFLPIYLFPVGLPVKIFKALHSNYMSPAHLNLVDLITLTIFGERYKL